MNDPLKRFAKYLGNDDEKTNDDLHTTSGYVQSDSRPYDRLKRSLQRIFPALPPLFDRNADRNADEK